MGLFKWFQRAGNNSNQYHVENLTVNQGITEERAREIYKELIPQTINEYTKDAYALANERIEKLENSMLERAKTAQEIIPAFSDPAFQRILRKAQQAATVTDEKRDYDLLTELLVCHVEKGKEKRNRAGIEKALEIVDRVDNRALCGLTAIHAFETFVPITGDMEQGLEVLGGMFEKLEYEEFPQGTDWIDHLDILNAVRISPLGGFNKLIEYYPKRLQGYSCVGIRKDSETYKKAVEMLQNVKLNEARCLIPNSLLDGYVKLNIRSKEHIRELIINSPQGNREINSEEVAVLESIWDSYDRTDLLQKQVDEAFVQRWDSIESLRKFHEWWDTIPTGFDITSAGKILAHTNAKRCDPSLPDLL